MARKHFKRKVPKVSKAVRKYVHKELKEDKELKYLDVSTADTTTVTTTGVIVPISNMAQGVTEITRIGDQVTLYSVEGRGNIVGPLLGTAVAGNALYTDISFRLMIFWDNNAIGTIPIVAQTTNTNGVLETASSLSLMAKHNLAQNRYHLLYEKFISLKNYAEVLAVGGTSIQQLPISYVIQFKKKLKHKVHYLSAGADQPSLGKGNLYMLYITDNANSSEFNMRTRVTYTDS